MSHFMEYWRANARLAWTSSWKLVFSSAPRAIVSCLLAVIAGGLAFLATADKNGFQNSSVRALAAFAAVVLVVGIVWIGTLLFWSPYTVWRDTHDRLQRIIGDPDEEMSLAALVRHIAEGSVWTRTLDPEFDDFPLPLAVTIKDWFVSPDSPTVFGRRFGPQGPIRGTTLEPIAKDFWLSADIDATTLLMNRKNLGSEYSLVYDGNRINRVGGFLDVRVNASAARQKWVPLPLEEGPTNRYIRAVALYRDANGIT